MSYRIQFEQLVSAPIERVFLFFTNPDNLPRIMPPQTGTGIVRLKLVPPPGAVPNPATTTTLAGAGSEIVTSFRIFPLLPFRAQWVALITEFEWNHHFADVQKKGPFKYFRHRHEFSAMVRDGVNGTVVRDVIEYEIGFGILGSLAQKCLVARQLRQTFDYRQKALAKLLA
jgi:ligand-binding SRPBCC domain-containing protein